MQELTLKGLCSIPFCMDDISKAMPAIDPTDIKLSACLSDSTAAKFLQDAT